MGSKTGWAACVAAVGLATVADVAAQPPPPSPPDGPPTLFYMANTPPLVAFGGQIDILRGEGGVVGPLVKDKPYSARSITESIQTLADGNRITQRNEATIYRDSQGRTRREQTLRGVGPWQAGEPVTIVNIHDPVADKTFVLDPVARTARELRPFRMAFAEATAGVEVDTVVGPAGGGAIRLPPPGAGVVTNVRITRGTAAEDEVRIFSRGNAIATPAIPLSGVYEPGEDLGEQILEGLLVQGTRLTDTIPAGAMGNERPIEIVTERWYSKDIDAIVQHRFFDPRFGETLYRLVNVVRGEPSPDLFVVPQGYELTTEDSPIGLRRFELQRQGPRATDEAPVP